MVFRRLVLWTVMPLGSVANDRLRHRRIGYARVSKADGSQSLDLPRDALQAAGVDAVNVYHDFATGARDDRPGLDSCMRARRAGDVLVVWKLARLGRFLYCFLPNSPDRVVTRRRGSACNTLSAIRTLPALRRGKAAFWSAHATAPGHQQRHRCCSSWPG